MARLVVKLHGQHFSTLTLENGQEYIIGRGADCAVVLQEQKGISRQHLKVFQRDDSWYAESLSRFVPLQQDGEQLQEVELAKDAVFSAPPYEFSYEANIELEAAKESTTDHAVVPYKNEHAPFSATEDEPGAMDETVVRGNLEATIAGLGTLIPFLRIHYLETDTQEVLRLEGELWVAGRDSTSEIPLRDSRISRRHFELSKMNDGIFVIDLGSANGTKLNGEKIPPHEPVKLESGDTITVLEIELTLEIHDTALLNRMQQLPSTPMYMPQNPMQGMAWPALPAAPSEAVLSRPAKKEFKDWKLVKNWPYNFKLIDYKKHKIRVALVAMLPFLLYGALSGSGEGRSVASKSNEPLAFDKLSPEQKNAVKDTFTLARSLYMQGRYELCLAELAKMHEVLPSYENSKEVEAFCTQGHDLTIRQKDIDRREKEKALLEQQITTVVEGCKERLKNNGTVEQIRECLAPAMELNPEHPAIAEMIGAAQGRAADRKMLEKERAARRARMARGEAAYGRAKALYKQGKLAKAIVSYERFIETPYPDLSKTKESAVREVASIRGELNKKVTGYLDQCRAHSDKNRYKEAWLACQNALKEDPNNEQAKVTQSKVLSALRRDLKSIYEDSVLEESLGNVDSAKEKWKKIIHDDLEFDEYSKKARTLLRKYGIEL